MLDRRLDHRTMKVKNAATEEDSSQVNPLSENRSNCCISKRALSSFKEHSQKTMRPQKRPRTTLVADRFVEDKNSICEEMSYEGHSLSAEHLASSILDSILLPRVQGAKNEETIISKGPSAADAATPLDVTKRPRIISEADEMVESSLIQPSGSTIDADISTNISCYLNLSEVDRGKEVMLRHEKAPETIPHMLHASISDEARLRDRAMAVTRELVKYFNDKSLGLFFGYKSSSAKNRDRLTQLLGSFLFDTSHAMFAWVQTEHEIMSDQNQSADLDMEIRTALFDRRATEKIGGFKSHSILPQAISIGRLRARNTSWEKFTQTAQGKIMFAHLSNEKSTLDAGKERRGQRLRQRHWLTSELLMSQHESDENQSISSTTQSRSRSTSFASEAESVDDCESRERKTALCTLRKTQIFSHMVAFKAISLRRESQQKSWGVGLLQEGRVCVIGKAVSKDIEDDAVNGPHHLRCGDVIVFAHNGNGECAASPLCPWLDEDTSDQKCFRSMVDLFRKSTELHLVIRRA